MDKKTQNNSPRKSKEELKEIALGIEAYYSEMCPLTKKDAKEISERALSIFSEEEKSLL